jgi:hypothetical protein
MPQMLHPPQIIPSQPLPAGSQPGVPPGGQPVVPTPPQPKQAAAPPAPEPSMIKSAGFWGPPGNSPKEILSGRPVPPPEPPKEKKGWNWFSREKSK